MPRKLLGKTPLAWLQLTKQKTRLAVAIAGIAFADVLMFIQLGILDGLYDSATQPHRNLRADLVLVNVHLRTLVDVKSLPRERLHQVLAYKGVESIHSLYVGDAAWRNPNTQMSRSILVWGIDPASPAFTLPELTQHLDQLKLLDRMLFDQASRPEYGPIASLLQQGVVEAQVSDQTVQVIGLFNLGASFGADGNVITSDSTFLKLFRDRPASQIDIGLIQLKPGTDLLTTQAQLRAGLPPDVEVLTVPEFIQTEVDYWASGGTGFIFNLGVAVGFIVGIVIVYQILYANVSEHLTEYATLKAMGYGDRYLLIMLMQQALILAALGYIPGFMLSLGLYQVTYAATLIPIAMKASRAIMVLLLTIIMCAASGAIAARKLRAADPADIF